MKTELRIRKVKFSYEKEEILKGIDAEFSGTGMYAVFGPNGSGKTTLLKCCTGILLPREGSIELQGRVIHRLSYRERSRQIAYVPQEHRLTFPFTVEEVILMGRTPHLGGFGHPSREDTDRVHEAMDEIGIRNLAPHAYTRLSGGQRQLVLLSRAIAQDTPVVILDEPTSALDFKNQLKVFEILQKMAGRGKTVIACTHDPNHVKWFCEKVLILKDGQVLHQGNSSDVLTEACLEELYGDICELKHGMILPRLSPG